MAGLAGVIGPGVAPAGDLVARMAAQLAHSPAATLDLWSDGASALCRVRSGIDNPEVQPLWGRDGRRCIVFFGECFGYEQKRAELSRGGYPFRFAANDAEFCLALFEVEGEKAFGQLSGSYCFAILDPQAGELLLVNDRLGTRPVFYALTGSGRLVFGSQVPVVLQAPDIPRQLDESAALQFCALQRVLGTKTLMRHVSMLPPASVLRYRAGTVDVRPYWTPRYRPQPGSVDDYAEELAQVLRRAVGQVCRGGAQVAMLLSGGLDARMVLAAAETPMVAVTFGDYENPEAQAAREVAAARGFEWRFLRRDPDHYLKLVDAAVDIGGGMHPFNHAHGIGFVDALAREFDVVTHGYAPELLFRGTSLPKVTRRFAGLDLGKRLDPTLNESNLAERLFARGYGLMPAAESVLTPLGRRILADTLAADAQELVAEAAKATSEIYDIFLWPDVRYHARYPSMLFETSLRSYMTERSFVFHNEVIDLHLRMPCAVRSDNRLWLKAMARLNRPVAHVRDANTGHSPFMPQPIVALAEAGTKAARRLPLLWRLAATEPESPPGTRGLSPISWPRFDWMIGNHPGLRALITETLSDARALPSRLFDAEAVQRQLAEHLSGGQPRRHLLFALLTLGVWNRKYVNP